MKGSKNDIRILGILETAANNLRATLQNMLQVILSSRAEEVPDGDGAFVQQNLLMTHGDPARVDADLLLLAQFGTLVVRILTLIHMSRAAAVRADDRLRRIEARLRFLDRATTT